MRLYVITIKPRSPLGTPLKGDTLFGQFCWQAVEHPNLLSGGLQRWIDCYTERPMAVFSSAWPVIKREGITHYAIRRPDFPLSFFGEPDSTSDCAERLTNRKKNKGRKWLLIQECLQVQPEWSHMIGDKELFELHCAALPEAWQKRLRLTPRHCQRPFSEVEQQHNTINRLTVTTGKGELAPYSMMNSHCLPEMELVIFAGLDEEAGGGDQLREAISRIGQWGFGRDASTGLGRFDVTGLAEITVPVADKANCCLTLGPCVPEQDLYRLMFFTPFTRFGRHGAQLLHTRKPFKNPVVMADEGAVLVPASGSFPDKPYVGRAVGNISKAMPEAVCQGYSLVLPMEMPNLANGGHHGTESR